MDSWEQVRTAFGIIGNVIGLILFLSPMPTLKEIVKKRSVEQFPAAPYLAMFINCSIWVLYGLPMVHPHSLLVLTINGLGLVIATVYLILFLIYSNRWQRCWVLSLTLIELVLLGGLSSFVLVYVPKTKVRSNMVGIIAVFSTLMIYVAPNCFKGGLVNSTVRFMPNCLNLFTMLNGLCWTVYALIRFDLYIVLASVIGLLVGIIQLIRQIWAARKKTTEPGLPEMGQCNQLSEEN